MSNTQPTLPRTTSTRKKVLAVIPARYQSSRFPGKPLAIIHDKPMIQHVWERVTSINTIDKAIVATDDKRIYDAAVEFGGQCVLTNPNHPSGSDRVWEVAKQYPEYELVLNVQGDEPFIPPENLAQIITLMQQTDNADVGTIVTAIEDPLNNGKPLYHDPNIVKAVLGENNRVFYFSRAPIPFYRCGNNEEAKQAIAYRHLGVYLYQRQALEQFTKLSPSALEKAEKLEQLRALEAGMSFYATVVKHAPVGVDTPEDLHRLLAAKI